MNFTLQKCLLNTTLNCSYMKINVTDILTGEPADPLTIVSAGKKFYAYFTPLILLIGLLGNCLSLCVFLSRNMRGLSASRYLAALSAADISTLIFYVFSEWLRRGLKHISADLQVKFLDTEGVCQTLLYFNYVSRFMSAWLIVCFTCERFVGVCMPFKRRNMGSVKGTMKIIISVTLLSCVLLLYKPILSEVYTIRNRTACTSRQEHVYVSFILDSIYGLLITLVPFVIITVLNALIICRLFLRSRRHRDHLITEESHIRLEFTFILLAISFFFIAFNLPFFVVWFRNFLHSQLLHTSGEIGGEFPTRDIDYWTGVLSFTRTIFYMNYCVNFFLYSITGAYFRRELRGLFTIKDRKLETCSKQSNNTHYTQVNIRNSWV